MLNEIQHKALTAMAERNIGAIVTKFGWTWPEHVRNSEEKALAVLAAIERQKA